MTLLDVCELIVDCPHSTAPDEGQGYPLIRTPNIGKGRLILEGVHRVSKEIYDKRNERAVPKKNDLILAREAPVGNVAIIKGDQEVCLGQRTVLIRPNIDIVDPDFLVYYLLSPEVQHVLINSANGATVSHLNMSAIRKLAVNLPKIEEQRKIGRILSSLADKIEINKQINRNLQEQAEAIYKKLIVDEADDRWTEGSLSDIADIIMGQSPKGDTYNENGEGTVFYQGRGEFGARFPTRRLFTSEPKRMAQTNDVLMSVRAPVGDFNVAYESCCIGRGLAAIRSKDNHQSYILYTTISLQEALNMYNGEGTVFGSINKDSLNGILVNIPPLAVMDEFEKAVKPIDEIIRNSYEEICRLTDLRDAILPRLMSGELDVSDIDI